MHQPHGFLARISRLSVRKNARIGGSNQLCQVSSHDPLDHGCVKQGWIVRQTWIGVGFALRQRRQQGPPSPHCPGHVAVRGVRCQSDVLGIGRTRRCIGDQIAGQMGIALCTDRKEQVGMRKARQHQQLQVGRSAGCRALPTHNGIVARGSDALHPRAADPQGNPCSGIGGRQGLRFWLPGFVGPDFQPHASRISYSVFARVRCAVFDGSVTWCCKGSDHIRKPTPEVSPSIRNCSLNTHLNTKSVCVVTLFFRRNFYWDFVFSFQLVGYVDL